MPIATIAENDRKERFIATAGQTVFPYDFPIYAAADLQVRRERAGAITLLALGTDYSVTGVENQTGGNVVLTTGANAGDIIVILSAMSTARATQFVNGGDLAAAALEAELNRIRILFQQNARDGRNALLFPPTDPVMQDLPPITLRANRFLAFDASGQPIAATPIAGTVLDALSRLGDNMIGSLGFLPGSANNPGLRPTNDNSSGFFAGPNFIGITVNGQEAERFINGGMTFTAALTNAVARTIKSKLMDQLNISDFGVIGNNIVNDQPAIQSAFNAAQVFPGKAVQINRGTYRLAATAGRALFINAPFKLSGEGALYSSLNPAAASASDDTLYIQPNPANGDFTLSSLQDFAIHNPFTGTRVGRSGIFLDTQAAGSNQVALFSLERIAIGQGSNYGFWHLNNPTNNPNGGMYCARITGSVIKGGIKLESSGDSNNITENILTGDNIGVNASLVAGASLLQVQGNNITNSGGAIRIDSGSRFRILGNNIENYLAAGAAAQNNAAVINITGTNGIIYGGTIHQNLISAFNASDALTLIRLRNARGVSIEDNVLLNGGSATTGIDIGSDCQDIKIGANLYNAAITTPVNDNGVGTMGVVKTAALQNNWVAFLGTHAAFKYIKSADGLVHCYGAIKNGTTTNGTLITTLPQGFRPSEIIRCPIQVINAGTPQIAEMTIESDGSVRINYVLTNAQVQFNFSFPSANLANAVSLE